MKYEEIELLKQSPKSTVYLVRQIDSGQTLIRKVLKGPHPVYLVLKEHSHPCLPVLNEVTITDNDTTVVEEYVEGQPLDNMELSEVQFLSVVRELCSVLEFLHGQGIIHRDIKPSNIIMASDGHIRLIDFDAARKPKDNMEQDTVLLGTRGFAPPEQYGFAQTDERADIYSLGVTLSWIGQGLAQKPHYKRIIRKCTDLDPAKRYQSVRQVRQAFLRNVIFFRGKILPHGKSVLCAFAVLCIVLLAWNWIPYLYEHPEIEPSLGSEENLIVLSVPDNPHWDGETGIGTWSNVFESGTEGDVKYHCRLYRKTTDTVSDTNEDILVKEFSQGGNRLTEYFEAPMSIYFQENGFYYFTVCAAGDGTQYADSPYVTSDLFEFTGEAAPMLPLPENLAWNMTDINGDKSFYAIWSNLDEYEDRDRFRIRIYKEDGTFVTSNTWSKELIMSKDIHGIEIRPQYLSDITTGYRFTLQVISSRPNKYRSTSIPDPIPEEYYSSWYFYR